MKFADTFTDPEEAELSSISFSMKRYAPLDTNLFFHFSLTSITGIVSDFKFDTINYTFQGNYNVVAQENPNDFTGNGKPAIISGSFTIPVGRNTVKREEN